MAQTNDKWDWFSKFKNNYVILLFCDKQSCIALTKHIEIKYHFAQEKTKN
jgi:hypothetical protein